MLRFGSIRGIEFGIVADFILGIVIGFVLETVFWFILRFILGLILGIGWVEMVVVCFDGSGDGVAPAVGAEGVDVFVLGLAGGLH